MTMLNRLWVYELSIKSAKAREREKMKNSVFKSDGTETNGIGGKQSKITGRFDLLPAIAISTVSDVLAEGAKKYGERNWEKITVDDHINHALNHIFGYMARDNSEGSIEDHITHATTRLLFALDLIERMKCY